MTIIGVTGSRWGMDEARQGVFGYIYTRLGGHEFHHGMCSGVDTQSHELVRTLSHTSKIVGHPPIVQGKFYTESDCDELMEPEEYLKRDKNIVDRVEVMVGVPETAEEKLRSGTWATIRYAKKMIKADKGRCKRLYIINPDAKVVFFDKNILSQS